LVALEDAQTFRFPSSSIHTSTVAPFSSSNFALSAIPANELDMESPMKKLIIPAIISGLLAPMMAIAEPVTYRFESFTSGPIPELGVGSDEKIFVSVKYDDEIQPTVVGGNNKLYENHQQGLAVKVETLGRSFQPTTPSGNSIIGVDWMPGPVGDNVNVHIHSFNEMMLNGFPSHVSTTIDLNGISHTPVDGLFDLTSIKLPPNSNTYGRITIAGNGNLDIFGIEKCNGDCDEIVPSKQTIILTGKVTNGAPEHGIQLDETVELHWVFDPDYMKLVAQNGSSKNYVDANARSYISGKIGNVELNLAKSPTPTSSDVFVDYFFDGASGTRATMGFGVNGIEATGDNTNYVTSAHMHIDGTLSESDNNGGIFDPTVLNNPQGMLHLNFGPGISIEITGIKAAPKNGGTPGVVMPENTADVSITAELTPPVVMHDGSVSSNLALFLEHTGTVHYFMHQTAFLVTPSGFVKTIPVSENRIGLGPHTSGHLNVPVEILGGWESGEYKVVFGLITESGLFASTELTIQK
jgi:hypothetical protein